MCPSNDDGFCGKGGECKDGSYEINGLGTCVCYDKLYQDCKDHNKDDCNNEFGCEWVGDITNGICKGNGKWDLH